MNGKLFTLFISAILTSEIRRRMAGLKEEWTFSKVRTALDKITFSKVKVEHLKKAKDLRGIISACSVLILPDSLIARKKKPQISSSASKSHSY